MNTLSPNTQAILLLTAPLLFGRAANPLQPLTLKEYGRLAHSLYEMGRQPAELLGDDARQILAACAAVTDPARVEQLLDRGFLLSQVLERWQSRGIWVISRADEAYPKRLRDRLKDGAPAILYGCGDVSLLVAGGMAVVGSRNVTEEDLVFTQSIGALCGRAGVTVVSGGARGVDAAAMLSCLDADGRAVGVLADSLESAVLSSAWRAGLQDGRLLLVSPYDPRIGFLTCNAMGLYKLIYTLADIALVVASDVKKGGTWNGAVEQLDRYRCVPVYVRHDVESAGLADLRKRGALDWPAPTNPDHLFRMLPASSNSDTPISAEMPADSLMKTPSMPVVPASLEEPDDAPAGQGVLF